MTNQNPESLTRKRRSRADKSPGTAASLREASAKLKHPEPWIKRACEEGDARTQGGRIDLTKAQAWINAHIPELEASKEELTRKEQKLVEEIRNLRLKNDQREGSLVLKSWVAERFYRGAGEVNNVRVQLEALYPVKLAEAAGDIPKLRVIFRQGIDELMEAFLSCGKHFR